LTRFVSGSGEDTYYIDEGKIHEILDEASVEAAGITLPAMSAVEVGELQGLTWGDPIASNATLFTNRTTGAFGVYVTGQFYQLDPATATAIDFTRWFTATAGTLSSQGLSTVDRATVIKPFIRDTDSNDWLLTADGKVHISQTGAFIEDAPVVSPELLKEIRSVDQTLASPALVKNDTERFTYFVSGGAARQTVGLPDRDALIDYVAQPQTITLSKPAFAQLKPGLPVLAPGSIVKSRTTKQLYLVNSWTRALKIADPATVDALELGPTRLVNDSSLIGYVTKYSFSGLKFVCDGETFIPVNGLALRVEDDAIAEYPGRATKLSSMVCSKFVVESSPAGLFFKDANTSKYYLVQAGKKRLISSPAAYRKLATGKTKAFVADANLLARIPTGLPAPAALGTGTGTGETTGGTNSGSTGGSQKTVVYTVAPGDSLNKIAAKFSTTVAKIMATNKISNPNSISVGLKLTIVIP
jgi:LysM repeat protein